MHAFFDRWPKGVPGCFEGVLKPLDVFRIKGAVMKDSEGAHDRHLERNSTVPRKTPELRFVNISAVVPGGAALKQRAA